MNPVPSRYDNDRDAIVALLAGEPKYRADQVWDALYRLFVDPDAMTNLPRALRVKLDDALPASLRLETRSDSADAQTSKFLWTLHDDHRIETVLMLYPDRATVCVSTQAGCAMGCGFCATGQGGFDRQLTTGEIIEQVVRAARHAAPRRVSNVVFMGMGEPLANYDAVWAAVQRLHGDVGISARHLTISTVGIIPGIRRLGAEPLPVNLAVSLHAANDRLRDELVPINRRYPLAALAAACDEYVAATRRRLSFEWAMIAGTNDSLDDAAQLADYALARAAHVNLIPLNPTPGWPTVGSSPAVVRRFSDRLTELGVNVTVRHNRGTDIDAACGQLKASHGTGVDLSPRKASSLTD